MFFKRIQTVLALLLMGSVSMLADGSDPFPDVNYHQWQNTMVVTGKVMLNGVELKNEAIVAAYYNDEIRGKKQVNSNGKLYLSIGGAAEEVGIPLHFKVFTGSSIVEVDQGLKYIWNEKTGTSDDPYLINLTVVTTNTSSEGWATTCLPYNAAVPDGVTVFSAKSIEDGVLKIEPVQCTILPKETPVLLKTDGQQSVEWLSRVADGDATIGTNLFKGTTEAMTVSAESVLTLGHALDGNKEIGFWLYTGTNIPANRAYLERVGSSRGLTLNWEDNTMGIKAIDHSPLTIDHSTLTTGHSVYDLQGRPMVNGQRSMVNGQIRITNGKKYLVR